MSDYRLQRKRTFWDLVLGVLLVIAGLFILGHAVLATVVSVLFLGWLALSAGVIALVAAVFRIGRDGFWPLVVSGGLLAVLGLVVLRNPDVTAVTLTLVAGALFLTGGLSRLVGAFQNDQYRWVLLVSGAVSVLLGLSVLFNVFEATFTLLGVLLGVQTLLDGFTLLLIGRVRPVKA